VGAIEELVGPREVSIQGAPRVLEPSLAEIIGSCPFTPQAVSTDETYTPPADRIEAMTREPATVLALRVWPKPARAWWRPRERRWNSSIG